MKGIAGIDNDRFSAIGAELPQARHISGDLYTSPAIYDLEKKRCFHEEWIFVGRTEEAEAPGDYFTREIAGESIVVSRDQSGTLRAFYNMCAHRGARVVECESGNAKRHSCPYHAWVYDSAGNLCGAPHMRKTEGFATSQYRMKPVHLTEWQRNIFVCFAEKPPSFSETVDVFGGALDVFQMENCRLARKFSVDFDCNWKLFVENAMDIYHVRSLHAASFGKYVEWDEDLAAAKLYRNGGYHYPYRSGASAPGGKAPLGTMPWLQDHPQGNIAVMGFTVPNLTIFARFDSVRLVTAWPLSVDRCRMEMHILFPAEFFDLPQFSETVEAYVGFANFGLEEDRTMIESLQRSVSSPAFEPGPLSCTEKLIHNYINAHLRTLSEDPAIARGFELAS
jgi:phenylpropionate dioxygenase-like ring-hydroxylating dioxygenase large terminal subunit